MCIVSVITAVYNDQKFIAQSAESILNQTIRDFEYIIVDDGSTDDTLNILNQIAKRDKRIKILTQKNVGPANARNEAIKVSKGFYIALQDSDDISFPTRLESQISQLVKSGANIISCTSYNVIDPDDEIITVNNKIYPDINKNILKGNFCVCHPSIMAAKELIILAGGYNPFYRKTEDYDLILRLIEKGARFEKVNSVLYSLRIRPNSEGSTNNGQFSRRVYENHLNRVNNKEENFNDIVSNNKKVKNYYLKRLANELFYSENYSQYIQFYLKQFYKLPAKSFLLFFIFSLLPSGVKVWVKDKQKAIKS